MKASFSSHRRIRQRLLLLVVLLAAQGVQAAELEDRVKAAFLFNVAKFVTWPDTTTRNDNAIDICVYRDPDFAGVVRELLTGKRVGVHPVNTHSINTIPSPQDCQIIYIGENALRAEVVAGMAVLQDLPILTVGEPTTFVDDGGIMRLKRQNGKLRFEVAMLGVQRSGLVFSSKLLRLADIIPAPGA